jgi:uncharacterized membrane protein
VNVDVGMLITGIVFSDSLFNQGWFLTLAAFVAFNTIVFVGLSLGKIFYWPKVRIRPVSKRPTIPVSGDRDV